MKHKGKYWACPLCLEGVMPFGKMDCEGLAVCGNTPNYNAPLYMDKKGYVVKRKGNKAIGIGAISNEED